MSLATLLLAFAPAIFHPKFEPEKSDRELELEGEIDRLLRLNEAAAGRIDRLEAERDSWRRRYDESQAMLAALAGDRIDRRLERAQQLAQYQQGLANAQANAQYQQQAMMNAQNYFAGLQPFQDARQLEHICNCVPARHDMFLGGLGA